MRNLEETMGKLQLVSRFCIELLEFSLKILYFILHFFAKYNLSIIFTVLSVQQFWFRYKVVQPSLLIPEHFNHSKKKPHTH